MKARDPYHLAVAALTDLASAGRFGWGRPLAATALAAELGLSPTPVREALARLAGEGVLEHRPGHGYFAPSPTASDIADLYELHWRLSGWAIERISPGSRPASAEAAPRPRIEAFYDRLVASAGNDVLDRVYRRAALQLRPVRQAERLVDPDVDDDIVRQETLLLEGRLADLRPAIDGYHRRRIAAAQAVFSVMRRATESIDRI
ncbi:MAG: GntR family transcriptional regulator [Brevundimonas sp.]